MSDYVIGLGLRITELEQQLATLRELREIDSKKLAAKVAEIAMLRTGDTCARQCEGTAYRIEARSLKRQLAAKDAVLHQCRKAILSHYDGELPNSISSAAIMAIDKELGK